MQDERLQPPKGQPRLSSFLTVLVKTGRYATNWVRIDFDTAPDFGKSGIIRLPTKGEMIGRVMLVANMPDISTRQIEAYYTRNPKYLANSNYIMLELYKNRNYVRTTKFNYPTSGIPNTYPVGDLGIAKFMGVQLDDLSIGGLYSITSSLPLTDTSTASFSMTLTDKPFDTEHIDILNKDTFLLGGLLGNNAYIKYSYNGLKWQDIDISVEPFTSLNPMASYPKMIIYNGDQYAAVGNYTASSQSIYVYSPDDIVLTQPSGVGNYIAYNGSQYISVGQWSDRVTGYWFGCILYSTDGISWSSPVDPIGVKPNGICRSVAWVPSRNSWIAVGRWESPLPPPNDTIYMIAKSSDGITWTPQSTTAGNTFTSIANTIAVNGLTVVIGGKFDEPYSSSLMYSTDGGNTWSLPTGPGGTEDGETKAVAWTGYIWVAVGTWINVGESHNTSISVSSDGIAWAPATNPLGTTSGDANTIALSPTEMVIGGKWSLTIPAGAKGTLSKASNIAETYKFGPLIRPTQILNDIVNIKGIALDPVSGRYLLLGSWVDVNGDILGSISITTDITRWGTPFNPIDNTITSSQAFAATTADRDRDKWVVVGYWRYGGSTKGQSIIYSDDITGTTWHYPSSSFTIMTCVPIYGQNTMILTTGNVPNVGDILSTNSYFLSGTYITHINSIAGTVTVTLSSNCINPSNPASTVIEARTDIEGYATNVITDGILGIIIVTGSWTNGSLRISDVDSISSFSPPLLIPGTANGTSYSMIITFQQAGSSTYIVAGQFTNSQNNSPITLANITVITFPSLQIQVNIFMNPLNIDLTKGHVAKGVAFNYNNTHSIYVAVGQWRLLNGSISTIARSTDGITWETPINPPGVTSSDSISGLSVSWNGFQFVATGTWGIGTICISSDGINWAPPTDPAESLGGVNTANNVVWDPNSYNWVICGNWISSLETDIGNVATLDYSIKFSRPVNPQGAVTGKAASIAWNSNTSTWIAATNMDSLDRWTDITASYSGQLSTSSDGLIWTTPFMPVGIQYINNLSQITVIENRTYILGSAAGLRQSTLFSPNGLDWTLSRFSGNMYGYGEGISWNGSIWVLVGSFTNSSWGSIIIGPITTSTDGITWTNPIVPDIPVTQAVQDIYDSDAAKSYGLEYIYNLYSIAWNGRIFVAVGYIQIGIVGTYIRYTIGCVVTSSDGITWTVQTIPVLNNDTTYSTQSISGTYVAWNGQIWVVVGNFGTYPGSITSSSDGISWTNPVHPGHTIVSGAGTAVAWSGSIWVAIGYWSDVDGHIYYITTSTDGITWTTAIDPGSGNIMKDSVDSITWNGTMFIITGSGGPVEPGIIITSLDGLTWSVSSNPNLLRCITSKRVLPYVKPQPFDLTINADSYPQENGYIMTWVRHPVYGTGTQYFANITSQNRLTFTFTATSRTQWLTFGTYYNSESVVDISLNLIQLGGAKNPSDTSLSTTFKTDLVGPHFGWVNGLGHSLIDTASITIGGNLVETIPGQLMEILDEFQTPLEKVSEKNRQLCRSDNGFNQTTYGYSNVSQEVVTHIPFWFSRGDPGCVLPIDALNVDEVRLTINFKPLNSLYYTDSRTVTPAINVEGGGLWPMLNSQFYYQDSSGVVLPNLEPSRQKPLLNPVKAFPHLNMPNTLSLQDTYLLVEYIYLDKAEANRFRIADIQVPIVQHYTIDPVDTNANTYARIPLDIPNPTRDIFFFCQRYEAPSFNAHFLATRDLTTFNNPDPYALWWPDASGLDARYYGTLKPGFSKRRSEPIRWLALNYAETLNRYSTENVGIFRSMLPSLEQRKAPWLNKYIYNIPFGCQNGLNPISTPLGEANLDKVQRINLSLGFHGKTGDVTDTYAERFWVRVYAETYNIFRVYGGRGAMMFAY
uniref:Major capsid protein N-terminal domain-containing protein n=1 Tax=viral metagenome TaxID=1070528 RepID=A0A6C0K443_9ZZZZ